MKSKLSETLKPGVTATVDFNPVADRLRLMGSDGTSLRVNVDDGKGTVDGSHKFKEGDANAGKTPEGRGGRLHQFVEGHEGDDALQHRCRDRRAGDPGSAERRRAQHGRLAGHHGQRTRSRSTSSRPAKTRTTAGWRPAARSTRSISRPARPPWPARSRACPAASPTSPGSTDHLATNCNELRPAGLRPAGRSFVEARLRTVSIGRARIAQHRAVACGAGALAERGDGSWLCRQARPLRDPRLRLGALERVLSRRSGRRVGARGRSGLPTGSATAQLNLHGPGFTPAEVARLPVQPGNSDLCFEWKGPIADAIAHLERCGVAIHRGPMRRFGARGPGTSVYFRDPDGSLLEFISYRQRYGDDAMTDATRSDRAARPIFPVAAG